MTTAQQVLSIFTGVRGYLDDLSVNKIAEFEKAYLKKAALELPEIIAEINDKGTLGDDSQKKLIEFLETFKKEFKGA
jgi:F-type H+-transporting ATPase subunit alpha